MGDCIHSVVIKYLRIHVKRGIGFITWTAATANKRRLVLMVLQRFAVICKE